MKRHLFIMIIASLVFSACSNIEITHNNQAIENNQSEEISENTEYTKNDSPQDIIEYNFERLGIKNFEKIDLEAYEKKLGASFDNYLTYHFFYENDGLQIEAYISAPIDQIKDGSQNPCLIYNHGGNREYGALSEIDTLSYSYGLGMICLATNYRGCGKSEGADEFGGDDVNDVIRLIDLCEEMDFIDSTRINMLGASRGGMMTYETLRRDDRIHKAVVIAGIADALMECEERSEMKILMEELIGFSVEEKPEEYEKRSATYWADEISTPLMIFHTTGDKRVSIKQAEKIASLLEQYDKEYEYVSFESDIHGEMREEDKLKVKNWLYQ